MIGSLAICTVLYIATAARSDRDGPARPRSGAPPSRWPRPSRCSGMNWAAGIVAFGAVIATTAVLLVFQYGQARIFFSMARDGLLPQSFAQDPPEVPRRRTSRRSGSGSPSGLLSAFANLDVFIELTNIGTLFAFILVCIGILVLRRNDPHRKRAFRTPFVPFVPIAGIAICLYLIVGFPWFRSTPRASVFVRYGGLPGDTWLRFGSGSCWASSSTSSTAIGSPASPRDPHLIPTSPATLLKSAPGRPARRVWFFVTGGGNEIRRFASAACSGGPGARRSRREAATKKFDWASGQRRPEDRRRRPARS